MIQLLEILKKKIYVPEEGFFINNSVDEVTAPEML